MKYHLLTIVLLIAFSGTAQQPSFLGFYRDVAPYYNPAASGLEHSFRASLLYRDQWTGYAGAPRNFTGQVGAKLNSINSGVGLNVMHYEIGFSKSTSITGNYNYQWSFKDNKNKLSIGVAPKFYSLHYSALYQEDSSGVLVESSPEIRSNAVTMNIGAAFQTEKLFVAISAMNLIATEQQLSDLNVGHNLHFSVMSSYQVQLTERMKLIPHVHLQTDFVMFQPFVNLKVEHEKLWYQIGYRRNVMSTAVGYRFLGKINVGYMLHYSPDAPVYPHLWSHEAFIAYELK